MKRRSHWTILFALIIATGNCRGDEPRDRKAPDGQPIRVLIIGDSISIQGYTKYAAETLRDEMWLHHHEGNAQTTRNGLAKLDDWLAEQGGQWDIIHFNWGLWDLRSQGTHVPLAEYADNLEKLVVRLNQTDAALIFATTTPVPPRNGYKRRDSDVQAYNAAATKIMRRHGVAINDLYHFIQPSLDQHQKPNDVHFNQAGYQRLAESVVTRLRAVKASLSPARLSPDRSRSDRLPTDRK